MAVDKILIRSTPKITPSLITVLDTDTLKNEDGRLLFSKNLSPTGFAQRKGLMRPIVKLGTLLLSEDMIKSLSVWYDELVPRVSITLIDENSVFGAGGYPLTNIIASVYIQSQHSKLKSFSGDYIITSINSISLPGSNTSVYTISGELHVPKLNGQFSKSFSKSTSLATLKKVADELQLGFADNQPEDTKDEMTWLMPNYSYKSFINHVKKMAYSGEESFFDCFIDRYYTLNFINVEKMFSQDPETDKTVIALVQNAINKTRVELDKEEANDAEVDLVLSNYRQLKGSETFIKDFSMISNHGEILLENSLKKEIYWYDHGGNDSPDSKSDDVNFINHPVEPLITLPGNDGTAPQTVTIDEYSNSDTVVGVWKGVDYGNAHAEYKYANLLNDHNIKETYKNRLKIKLSGFNTTVLRGSRVAVAIFLEREAAMAAAKARRELGDVIDQKNEISSGNDAYDSYADSHFLDKALTGFYYVSSVSYSYNDGEFETTMYLARRHWLLPSPKNEIKGT